MSLGIHLLIEFHGSPAPFLTDLPLLKKTMTQAAAQAGATIVESVFHQFNPHGLSGVVVIAESHLAIHTWPEKSYAAIDIFTCGDPHLADRIHQNLLQAFQPTTHQLTKIDRISPSPTSLPPSTEPS